MDDGAAMTGTTKVRHRLTLRHFLGTWSGSLFRSGSVESDAEIGTAVVHALRGWRAWADTVEPMLWIWDGKTGAWWYSNGTRFTSGGPPPRGRADVPQEGRIYPYAYGGILENFIHEVPVPDWFTGNDHD